MELQYSSLSLSIHIHPRSIREREIHTEIIGGERDTHSPTHILLTLHLIQPAHHTPLTHSILSLPFSIHHIRFSCESTFETKRERQTHIRSPVVHQPRYSSSFRSLLESIVTSLFILFRSRDTILCQAFAKATDNNQHTSVSHPRNSKHQISREPLSIESIPSYRRLQFTAHIYSPDGEDIPLISVFAYRRRRRQNSPDDRHWIATRVLY